MQLTDKHKNYLGGTLATVFENSTDPGEASSLVGSLYRPHNLSLLRSSDGMSARMDHFQAVETSVSQLSYDAEIRILSEPFKDFYLVMLPLRGEFNVVQSHRELTATVNNPVILDADKPVDMSWSKPCSNLIFKVNKRLIEKSLFDNFGIEAKRPVEFNFNGSESGNLQKFSLLLSNLVFGNPYLSDIDTNLEVLRKIEEVLATALVSSRNNYTEIIEGNRYQILPKFVILAKNFIEENYASKITIVDVARFVGVSARSLQKGFEHFENTTPSLFLRRVRLKKAKEQLFKLRNSQNDLNVSDIALSCGFNHLGNFSKYYLLEFGESPSVTASGKTR
tara:strand:- start:9358 stop:10365 length:1008 start_codon:yes stop_codon:yes gene_type:complete